MVELRKLCQDIRKNCGVNEYCVTCKYKEFSKKFCDIQHITDFDINQIESLFKEEGVMNEH